MVDEADVLTTIHEEVIPPQDQIPPEDTTPEAPAEEPKSPQDPFPKKAVNAIDRLKKDNRRLRAQKRELQTRLSSLPALESKAPPKEEDFETWAEFLRAEQDFRFEQHKDSTEHKAQADQLTGQQNAVREQQDQVIAQQANEVYAVHPEVHEVIQANAEVIGALPADVADLFYDLDNPVEAGFVLALEGKLETLADMRPEMRAAVLLDAQTRGTAFLASRAAAASATKAGTPLAPAATPATPMPLVSKAPKPLVPATGSGGNATQTLDDMDAGALAKRMRGRK